MTNPQGKEIIMMNYGKRLLAAASVTAAAGTLVFSGLTAASAAVPAASGTEHFQIVTTSRTHANVATMIASGLFTGGGVDISGSNADMVKLPGGTFKFNHRAIHGSRHVNPSTCLVSIS